MTCASAERQKDRNTVNNPWQLCGHTLCMINLLTKTLDQNPLLLPITTIFNKVLLISSQLFWPSREGQTDSCSSVTKNKGKEEKPSSPKKHQHSHLIAIWIRLQKLSPMRCLFLNMLNIPCYQPGLETAELKGTLLPVHCDNFSAVTLWGISIKKKQKTRTKNFKHSHWKKRFVMLLLKGQ